MIAGLGGRKLIVWRIEVEVEVGVSVALYSCAEDYISFLC